MKKYLKQLSAMALAFVLLMMTAASVSAAGTKPTADDKATVTVTNVEAGMTVNAYKIVKANYNSEGFTGYEAVEGVTLENPNAPTQTELLAIVESIKNTTDPLNLEHDVLTWDETDKNYQKSLTAGSWLILVEGVENGNNIKIYNPMIASVSYQVDGSATENTPVGGVVDASQNWSIEGEQLYAKSSEPTIKKEIAEEDGTGKKADDVAYGDTVSYKITVTVPSYNTETFKTPTFEVKDNFSTGLKYKTDTVKVLLEGSTEPLTAGENTYEITTSENAISIVFKPVFILNNGQKTITIAYDAVLSEDAPYNFDPNTNKATLTYSNSPVSTTDAEDQVYVYTFGLDAKLSGNETITGATETHEIVKVDAGTFDSKITSYEAWSKEGKKGALSEAKFKLTKAVKDTTTGKVTAVEGTKEVYEQTSDANGALSFTGLDAGYYILVETEAPAGYSLDGQEHIVYIDPTYSEDGRLTGYTVTIDDNKTSTYTATYNTETKALTEIKTTTDIASFIKNTKLAQLPSTGGMGTYLFTIIGVAVMAAAAGLFIVRRRRNS